MLFWNICINLLLFYALILLDNFLIQAIYNMELKKVLIVLIFRLFWSECKFGFLREGYSPLPDLLSGRQFHCKSFLPQ